MIIIIHIIFVNFLFIYLVLVLSFPGNRIIKYYLVKLYYPFFRSVPLEPFSALRDFWSCSSVKDKQFINVMKKKSLRIRQRLHVHCTCMWKEGEKPLTAKMYFRRGIIWIFQWVDATSISSYHLTNRGERKAKQRKTK